MKRSDVVDLALAATILLVGACSPQAAPPQEPEPAMLPSVAPADGSIVSLRNDDPLGPFLVDGEGMTLYLFTQDMPNTSSCYGGCARFWPPLLTNEAPVAGQGVDAAKLGITMRTDGTMQVTYNGWPLYYWYLDKKAGDIKGQGYENVWFVISPAGEKIIE